MPKIEVNDDTLDNCDFHEVLEAFAGQSHLVSVGRWSNAAMDVFTVTLHKLPDGYYSFTMTDAFTTETPILRDGKNIGCSVKFDLGTVELNEAYDDLGEAMISAIALITKFAAERCAEPV
jgi:hypothetical protein